MKKQQEAEAFRRYQGAYTMLNHEVQMDSFLFSYELQHIGWFAELSENPTIKRLIRKFVKENFTSLAISTQELRQVVESIDYSSVIKITSNSNGDGEIIFNPEMISSENFVPPLPSVHVEESGDEVIIPEPQLITSEIITEDVLIQHTEDVISRPINDIVYDLHIPFAIYAPPCSGKTHLQAHVQQSQLLRDTDNLFHPHTYADILLTNIPIVACYAKHLYVLIPTPATFESRCKSRGLAPTPDWYADMHLRFKRRMQNSDDGGNGRTCIIVYSDAYIYDSITSWLRTPDASKFQVLFNRLRLMTGCDRGA
jgi:hypothetical protein